MKFRSLIQRGPIFLALLAVGLAGSQMAQGISFSPPTAPVTNGPVTAPGYLVPTIASFTPVAATNGALITIMGANFSTTVSNDIVYFGSVTATVKSATAGQLVVAVPAGSILAPITVTIRGLTAASSRQFQPEFLGDGQSLGASSFATGFTIPTGLSPGYTTIADFDGDGRPDLADADGNSHTITIHQNLCTNGVLSAASFAPPITLALPPDGNNGNPVAIHAVDLDGDGKLDLLVTELYANRITIYRNTSTPGTISFAPPLFLYTGGHDIRCAAAVDLDGDGRPDIVAANYTDNTISVLKNLSFPGSLTTNSFAAAVNFALPGGCQDLAVGDLDGDGKPDMAVSLYGGAPEISVFRNTASTGVINSNTFAPRVDFPGFNGAVSIKIGDVDGDGKPDLVVAFINSPQCLTVYRNLSTPGSFGTNSLASAVNFPTPGWAQGIALADFSGDGLLDLSVGGELPDYVSIYPNMSTPGSFTEASVRTPVSLSTGYNVWGLVAGDLSGDGRPALVFANQYDSNLEIYQNITPFAGPPTIVTQPLSQSVAQGGMVIFSVAAVGSDLSYQWCFNGHQLAGETGFLLMLTDVQPAQAGDYSVKVTSSYGSTTSSNALLTVITPPKITSEPTNQTVTNGVTVIIGVGASGTDLSYEWLFNGMPLSSSNIITTMAGNNSLGGTYAGDGGPATNAGFNYPANFVFDRAGNVYIADSFNMVVRKIDTNGIITTVAGNNRLGSGYSGDGGPATNATLSYPNDVALDNAGNLYIAETHNNVIRRVDTNGVITTVAGNFSLGGGYSGDGGPATNAALNFPEVVLLDGGGNMYFSDSKNNVIRRVGTNGIITTVVGNFSLGAGYSGDGGAATNAQMNNPNNVAFDAAGNLYVTEAYNGDVRRVDAQGIITTVFGKQSIGGTYSGDGGPATNAALCNPNGIIEDGAGNFYLGDYCNNVVREVTPGGVISTFAGNYSLGGTYSGDGGAATNAGLNNPVGVALDNAGNLYIGDVHNNVIRKVSAAGYSVNPTNGSLALNGVQAGRSGNYQVIISNPSGSVTSSIVKLTVDVPPVITSQPLSQLVDEGGTAILTVGVVGTPPVRYQWTFNGKNLAGAMSASLTIANIHPSQAGDYAVKISTPAGNITSSNAVLTVLAPPVITSEPASQTVTNGVTVTIRVGALGTDLSYEWLFNGLPLYPSNIITTVAGNNNLGGTYSGDGGPALDAGMNYPVFAEPDAGGNLYIADVFNFVIRKVDPSGIINTVAGKNTLGGGYSGDGGPATNAALNYANCVLKDRAGNLYIPDSHNNIIRMVNTNGIITTVAGNYSLGAGYSGDDGPATNAALNSPFAITFDNAGNLFIADDGNNVIRKVSTSGIITTVAGNVNLGGGYSGDGGPAINAAMNAPAVVMVDNAGNIFIADTFNDVVRKVAPNGIITTVAGNHGVGYSGDGGAATNAALNGPDGLLEDAGGNLFIADSNNNVVRRVDTNGIITTAVGNYNLGGTYAGDGGAPMNAGLNNPVELAQDSAGNLYIGDTHNNVVRKVSAAGYSVNPTNGTLTLTDVQLGMSGNYQVVISNPAGSVTSSVARLTVNVPPVITSQPLGQTVIEGGAVTLTVGAQGTPPLQYQWTFNGRNLPGATGFSLTLTNIHPSQTGEYAVKISTPAGNITSSNALVTVIAQTILTYSFSGQESYIAGSQSTANNYSGELIFVPAGTNGVFVAWGLVNGQRRYWVDDLEGCTMYTIAGAGSQTYTVLGQASQNTNSSNPSLWSTIYQGQNTQLSVGVRQYFSFPSLFSGAITEVYPDPVSGNLVLYDSSSSYLFSPSATQTANNTGETTIDLENALINSLKAQGYKN